MEEKGTKIAAVKDLKESAELFHTHTLRLTRDEPDLGALTMTGRVWQEEEQDGRIRGKQAGRVHKDRRLAIFTIWY